MGQMKKIAVRVVHQTLHLQMLWKMSQDPDESVRAFVSRLVGTAELCDLPNYVFPCGMQQKPVAEMKL